MSSQITTAFTKLFTSGISHLAEQKESRTRNAVRVEKVKGGDRAFFDQIGSTNFTALTSRHADTPIQDTPHSRRMVTFSSYARGDLIDRPDDIRTLTDPASPYAAAFARGAGRTMDDVVIAAASGNASTGVDGGTSTALPAAQTIAVGGTRMTTVKLLEAYEMLTAAKHDPSEGFFCLMTAAQIRDLLSDNVASGNGPTIGSMDFSTKRALVDGTAEGIQWGGFTILRSEALSVVGGDQICLAWAKNSLLLAVAEEPVAKIEERPDKNYATQVYVRFDVGATRMQEDGVVEITCDL